MSPIKLLIALVASVALHVPGPAIADSVDELVELFRIQDEVEAQHRECIEDSSSSVEAELQAYLLSGELGLERGDEDWALLIAIYAEYYNALCNFLAGDEILNFYRSEFRKRFTPEEMDALIEMHQDPLARRLIDEWFAINRVYGDLVSERQRIDNEEAYAKFEARMENFWKYREEKLGRGADEQDT